MQLLTDSPYIDIIVVVIANVINLGMVAIFLVRTQGKPQLERRIGRLQIMLAFTVIHSRSLQHHQTTAVVDIGSASLVGCLFGDRTGAGLHP